MKTIIIALLAGSMLVCSCCILPKYGQIICKENKRCGNLTLNNGLFLRFKEVHYFFSFRRNSIVFTCELENDSGKRLVFDPQPFSITSKEYEYNLMRSYNWRKTSLFPDTFGLAPGEYDRYHVLYFRSKNKMSRKEFKKFYVSDTLKLVFANDDKKETVLRFVGRENEEK